jgi:hypothetical protein
MDETTATSEVRVVTLNLWGRRGEWNERRRVLAEGFRELAPDLVAFQEAVVGDGYDQVIDILGSGYHVAHQTQREADRGGDIEDGQGISIASRWPLGEVWEPDLNVTPRTEDFACGTLIAEVFAPEPIGPLLFVNHLPNWQLTFDGLYWRPLKGATACTWSWPATSTPPPTRPVCASGAGGSPWEV